MMIDKPPRFTEDVLERTPAVKSLSSIIKTMKSGMVLSVEAPWGMGKTVFLQLMKENLKNTHGLQVISFNAWETDHAPDPLAAFLGEMQKQINSNILKPNTLETLKDFGKKNHFILHK